MTNESTTQQIAAVNSGDAADQPADQQGIVAEKSLRIRYRVRFGKTDLLRWISHRDLATLWERLVRRAQLKLSMTEGFHPKPRIAFPSALALGVESLDEVVEFELAEQLSPIELLKRLVADNQPGLTIHSVRMLPEGFGKAQLKSSDYVVTGPNQVDQAVDWNQVQTAIDSLMQKATVEIARKKKTQKFDVAASLVSIQIADSELSDTKSNDDNCDDNILKICIGNPEGAVLKPTDVLDLMGLEDWIEGGAKITRMAVHLKKEMTETNAENYAAENYAAEVDENFSRTSGAAPANGQPQNDADQTEPKNTLPEQ